MTCVKCIWRVYARVCALVVLLIFTAPVYSLTAGDLAPALVQALQNSGLANPAVPVRAFSWVFEQTRPMRKPRLVKEDFSAASEGLSSVTSLTEFPDGRRQSRVYVSARGLLRYDLDDRELGVTLENFALPLQTGQSFRLHLVRDNIPLDQRCAVLEKANATLLHASIPGDVWRLRCEGTAQYKGMKIKASSTLFFLEKLGVFFNQSDDFVSVFGTFSVTQTLVEFKELEPL